MAAAAFFGHRKYDYYSEYEDKIKNIIIDLIENKGVNEFYNGYRGIFDRLCARAVHEVKSQYPDIKNIMVLSYRPNKDFYLPECFDESVYLIEKPVFQKYGIVYTNRLIVERSEYIVSGVKLHGGAYTACEYARRKGKTIVSIFE